MKAASGTGLREEPLVAPDADPPPPPVLADEPAVPELPVPEPVELSCDWLPLVDVDWSKVPFVLPERALPLDALLSWLDEEVVARVELFDVVALTPLVELAVSCDVPAEPPPPPPDPLAVVDELEPCM